MDADKVRKVFDFLEGKYQTLYLMYNHVYLLYTEFFNIVWYSLGKSNCVLMVITKCNLLWLPSKSFIYLQSYFKNSLLFCSTGTCHSDTTASWDLHSTITCKRHRHNLPLWISFTAVTVTFPHHMLYGFYWSSLVAHAHCSLFILKTILHHVATWQTLDNSERTHLLGVTDHNSPLLKWCFCLENSFKSIDVKTNECFVIYSRISCNHIWQQ